MNTVFSCGYEKLVSLFSLNFKLPPEITDKVLCYLDTPYLLKTLRATNVLFLNDRIKLLQFAGFKQILEEIGGYKVS